jgi:outer membrane lipoprotein-sorting protein
MKTAALTVSLLAVAVIGAPQTADQVVSRYLEARGGAARLKSVVTLRLKGHMRLGDIDAPFALELKRPHKMRTEFTINGQTGVQAYDGTSGWSVAPLPGEPARAMGPDEEREAREQADVDLSPLVDSKAKGYTVTLQGREKLSGGDAWKLLIRGSDGQERLLYLDTRTHLVVRTEETRDLDGQPVPFVTELGDYRSVDGLVYPHRMDTGPKGQPEQRQRLEIDTVEVNPEIDDARFEKPKSPPGR